MADPGSVVLGRRYALGEKIGAGGYSEVWCGTDLVLSRQVAIKLLHLGYARAWCTGTSSRPTRCSPPVAS